MENILASSIINAERSIHVATLARQTVIDSGAEHLGFGGYFIFEVIETNKGNNGIIVLGKMCSFEAAMRLADIWSERDLSRPNP
ncbi:hypothetical protein [Magnetospirillum molischianum]|uniref:Uncharacterized protein n=1 Tax=Magnetospirillum molischianum DSM 120 TaxID=1150626 RepID=H8FP33_MAGML|nr:hypothetical protein [Magnetospirillum molischianum]CCG40121.1 conserved hypothetical protein [Magnetospirillum molischianum DSM 120]